MRPQYMGKMRTTARLVNRPTVADEQTDVLQVGRMSTSDVVWSAHSITSSDSRRALIFETGGLLLALSAEAVLEVIDMPVIRSVPGSAVWFVGVSVYRERAAPVIDASAYLAPGLPAASNKEFNRAIVLRAASSTYLIAADKILNLGNLPAEDQRYAMPGMADIAEHRAIKRVCIYDNRSLAVIDLPELLRCTKLLRECNFC